MDPALERREAKRQKFSVDLKFLLRGEVEGAGALLDISASGLAFFTEIDAAVGDEIIVYPVGLGRLPGRVARKFGGGVAVKLTLSDAQRQSVEERVEAALSGAPYLKLTERRRDLRIKYNLDTVARTEGGETFHCTIVDMSRGGCQLRADEQPEIGTEITVGTLKGVVIRHVKNGFSVKFKKLGEKRDSAAA